MTSRHIVRHRGDAAFVTPDEGWARTSAGFSRWSAVDETGPAVHTGFCVCALEPGGTVPTRVQSYEEAVFVLEGSVILEAPEGATTLGPGDYGLVPPGVPHGWRNDGDVPAQWAEMAAPQPRHHFDGDTLLTPPLPPSRASPFDVRDPRNRRFGHVDPATMEVDRQTQDLLAVSASMRTALLVYSGITVKMMVDSDLGADLQTMFMVRYEPRGLAGPHDHPFEESYLILEGTVEAEFDGTRYRLTPGDIAFAGVGCVHGFTNTGDQPVRWLETQAPQPPRRHAYRFLRDWDHLR